MAPAAGVRTTEELAQLLRELRRRDARRRGGTELTYRDLAATTGWSHGIIGGYLAGRVLPPTDRFDVLVRLLGASPAEQGALATARDQVEEGRRRPEPTPPAEPAVAVPRQLPADVPAFTGRAAHLAALDTALGVGSGVTTSGVGPGGTALGVGSGGTAFGVGSGGTMSGVGPGETASGVGPGGTAFSVGSGGTAFSVGPGGTAFSVGTGGAAFGVGAGGGGPKVALITGTAGVGKTALAVHWAHRVAGRFPDGQLYVDLRGYDPQQPVDAGDALAGFLRGLGVPAAGIPAATAERAARYRTEVAGRRLLVVLDNAAGAEQVRPLLPGTGTCVVVVTSRDTLGGLVARDGAHPIRLGRLDRAESLALLRRLIGPDTRAAEALAERCAGLPLALRVAAARQFADDPGDVGALDAFDAGGDPHTALRSVFSWSLRRLSPAGARAFQLLGLHPGRVVDAPATAALAGAPAPAGRAMLAELARAHLVEPAGAGGYGMHDLLRAYSIDVAGRLTPDESAAAVDRLAAHLRHTAAAAAGVLFPHDRPAPDPPSIVDTAERAQRWLDRERGALVALARSRDAVELSRALWRYLEVGGHYREALALHTAAAVHGDADVLTNLGAIHWLLGDHDAAKVHFGRSLDGHRARGDRAGEARATARLALVHGRLGDHDEAAARLRAALAMYRAVGDRHGEAAQLLNLGYTYQRMHRHTEAESSLRQAADMFAALGDRRLEGYALGNLGAVESLTGRHEQALTHLRQALERCVAAGDRGGEGSAHGTIGAAYHRAGRPGRALGHLRRALAAGRATGECDLEVETLNTLGDVLLAAGRPDAAARRFAAARALAERTGDRHGLACALDGQARSARTRHLSTASR